MNAIAASSSTSRIVARLVRAPSVGSRNGEFLTTCPSRLLSLRAATGSPHLAQRIPRDEVADGVLPPTRGNWSPGCSLARRFGPHSGACTDGVAAFDMHPTSGPPPLALGAQRQAPGGQPAASLCNGAMPTRR